MQRNRTILQDGNRSAIVSRILVELGFKDINNVLEGIDAWKELRGKCCREKNEE